MIAIIELYQHDEVLRHYCDLLQKSNQKVSIFCSRVVYEMLNKRYSHSAFHWVVKEDKARISVFLKSNYSLIQQAKLVFITTALTDFKAFYQVSKIANTFLLVHNVHSFLAPDSFLTLADQQIYDRLRLLKIRINRAHFYKKQLLQNLAGLIFPTETMLRYVKNNFKTPAHLKLEALPFAYYNPSDQPVASQNKITITVPCTVISEHRNYRSVIDAIKNIQDKFIKDVQLVLLGQPKEDGLEIISDFKKLESQTLKIISFNRTIPTEVYDNWLATSDFLILPLKAFGRNHIYKEQLGYSKISGGVNDMIRFGIPALIPGHYPLEPALEEMVQRYDNNQLGDLLLLWVNQGQFFNHKTKTGLALANYSLKKMQLVFYQKVELLLKD